MTLSSRSVEHCVKLIACHWCDKIIPLGAPYEEVIGIAFDRGRALPVNMCPGCFAEASEKEYTRQLEVRLDR